MKKIVLTSLLAISFAGAANAATPYASLKLGYNNVAKADVEYKGIKIAENPHMNGYTGSVAGGLSFVASSMIGIRGELEYSYSNSAEGSSELSDKLSNNTIMFNGYLDFGYESWIVKPYVGVGVGYNFGTFKNGIYFEEVTDQENVKGDSCALIVGVSRQVDSNLTLDLGAKFTDNELTYSSDKDFKTKPSMWSILFGVRYAF